MAVDPVLPLDLPPVPPGAIQMHRLLPASRATVFEALIRPELIQRWMSPEHLSVESSHTDARVGGRFRLVMRKPDGTRYPATGEYTEIRAPELLAFSWTWEPAHQIAGVTTSIRIELFAHGAQTLLVMTHFGLPTDDERAGHHSGWSSALNRLERLCDEGVH